MDMSYKILWIDDDSDYIESAEEALSGIVQNHFMDVNFESYSDYDEFKSVKLDKYTGETFDFYDLILMDFSLSGITGDVVIRELREKKIYTDIVFYSSEFVKMRTALKSEEQLDGVFLTGRENLFSTIDQIIKKNLKREYRISNIRGLIMDSTSEFDYICQSTTIALFVSS